MLSDNHARVQLKRELAATGQCPFAIAALAIEQADRLQARIKELERKLACLPK